MVIECPGILDRILELAAQWERTSDRPPFNRYDREGWEAFHRRTDVRQAFVCELLSLAELAEENPDAAEDRLREAQREFLRRYYR